MIIALIVFLVVYVLYIVMDHMNTMKLLSESNNRIMNKINDVIDGVKTFFTVTLIDSISSAFDSTSDKDESEDTENEI